MPKKFRPAGDYRPLKVGTLKVKLPNRFRALDILGDSNEINRA